MFPYGWSKSNTEAVFICQNFDTPANWDISVNKIKNIYNLRERKSIENNDEISLSILRVKKKKKKTD
jgi:hypothetical protein